MRWIRFSSAIAAAVLATAACDRGGGIATKGKPGEFLISTLAEPPGHKVERSLGFYCRWFTYTSGDFGAPFTAANVALKGEAEKAGANAVVHWSATVVPPSEPKGTGGSVVMLCGDFAVVK